MSNTIDPSIRAGAGLRLREATMGGLAAIAAGLAANDANAQQAPSGAAPQPSSNASVEEIIVTAERRDERIENVPVAVTAVTGAQMEAAHIQSTADLSTLIPGLSTYQGLGFAMPHIRGIGNTVASVGIENPVATYVDDVYIASMSGSLFALTSVDHVEADKGPQGTLFGRNATGGVVQVITREPSPVLGGEVSAGYGNLNTVNATGYVTGGVASNLAADFAVYLNDQLAGYGVNLHTGDRVGIQNDLALRSKWLWTPTPSDRFELSVDYSRSSGNAQTSFGLVPGTLGLGIPTPSNPWDIDTKFQPHASTEQGGVGLKYEHDFGFATLINVAAYRKTSSDALFSFGLAPVDIGANVAQSYEQESEEIRLVSASSSPIKWVVGGFYLNAPASSDPFGLFGDILPVRPITNNTVTDQSEAVYGQATIPLPVLPATNLTIGARYSDEQRGVHGDVGLAGIPASFSTFSTTRSYGAPTWHIALDHHFTDDVMVYISDSRGFRAGTFNGNGTSVAALEVAVKPETLDAYEAGLKSEFLDHRVQLNGAVFYYNYTDIQVPQYTATGVTVLSGPKAKLYGADFDAELAITNEFHVRAGLSLLHSEFTYFPSAPLYKPTPGGGITQFSGPATGNQLPVAPSATFDLSAIYKVPLRSGAILSVVGTYYYEDRYFIGPDNDLAAPGENLLNGTLAWISPNGQYDVELWGRNLLNKRMVQTMSETAPWGDFEALQPPRTFGLTLRYKFGKQ